MSDKVRPMLKETKKAKSAHAKNRSGASESAESKLTMVTGVGCKVSTSMQLTADCGRPRVGWRYASADDVTCQNCVDGIHFSDQVQQVPPTFPDEWYEDGFEVEGHHANDGDDVPILCFECGQNWPCGTVLGTLPVLNIEKGA